MTGLAITGISVTPNLRRVLKLKAHIEQSSGRKLIKAPWNLEDASLVPAVGACTVCPQNTAMNTSLFGDLAIEEATCADGICFDSKRAAFVHIQVQAAGGEKSVARLQLEGLQRAAEDANFARSAYLPSREVWRPALLKKRLTLARCSDAASGVEAKKGSCPNVIAGVTVDWLESRWNSSKERAPGETLSICVTFEKCKVHPKAYEKKAESSGPGNNNGSAAEEAREKKKPLMIAENKLRIAFVSKAIEGITTIPAAALRFLLDLRLPNERYDEEDAKVLNALLPGIHSIAKVGKIDSAAFARAVALASLDGEQLQVDNDGWGRNPQDHRADLIKAKMRLLGYTGPDPMDLKRSLSQLTKAAKPAEEGSGQESCVGEEGRAEKGCQESGEERRPQMNIWRVLLLALVDVAVTASVAKALAWFVFKREAAASRQRGEMLAQARYSDKIVGRGRP